MFVSPLSLAKAHDFLAQAKPGSSVVYHRGELAADVAGSTRRARSNPKLSHLLMGLRDIFGKAALEGRVLLTQRRVAPDEFEYVATISRAAKPLITTV